MIYNDTTDVSRIWRGLGTFWNKLPADNKALIEQVWDGYLQGVDDRNNLITAIKSSISLTNLPETIYSYNEFFDVIYSGIGVYTDIVNTKLIDNKCVYYFNDDRQIINISGLTNNYWSLDNFTFNRVNLNYDVDYTISADGLRINFLNNPPLIEDKNNPYFKHSSLYASLVEYINPVLFNIYGQSIGLDSSSFINQEYSNYNPDYVSSEEGIKRRELLRHYKYIIQALSYYKLNIPTRNNLFNALCIARGFPFTYYSGIVNDINLNYSENNMITTTSGLLVAYNMSISAGNVIDYSGNNNTGTGVDVEDIEGYTGRALIFISGN